MKGLLLKDLYMSAKYCKSYAVIAVVFIASSLFSNNNLFFIYFPCLIAGMLPVTLLGYDEQSKWDKYCEAMPYTKAQIVSSKYIIGLIAQGFVFFLTCIAQAVKGIMSDNFNIFDYLGILTIILIMSFLAPSFCMPFVFKYGISKGRLAYYIVMGVACALGYIFLSYAELLLSKASPILINTAMCIFSVLVYVLSWFTSIAVYKKREIC